MEVWPAAIVPSSPRLPVQPIIVAGQEEPGMFDFFKDFPWFLKVHRYDTPTQLLNHLDDRVIGPVEAAVAKLRKVPAKRPLRPSGRLPRPRAKS